MVWLTSAASFLVLCATKVIMGTGALYMIHNPLTSAYGNAEKIKKANRTFRYSERSYSGYLLY